ncbi:hypothetical protein GN956_G25364 [Arapaima gigas]
MPTVSVSTDALQFGTIQCGLCKVITVQLFNPESVPCEWAICGEEPPRKKIDKHVPLHVRRRMWQEWQPSPVVFEMLPFSGVLLPGERVNVQVKFSPLEGVRSAFYGHLYCLITAAAHCTLGLNHFFSYFSFPICHCPVS